MTENGNIRTPQQRALLRRREIAAYYLKGYCAKEIFIALGERHAVTYGTIRNDIVWVRKVWADDLCKRGSVEGKERYLAAMRERQRMALDGIPYRDDKGRTRRTGRNLKLAFEIDKEVARLSGVKLASDTRTIHLDVKAAQDAMEDVMAIVFRVVTGDEDRAKIISLLEEAGHEGH